MDLSKSIDFLLANAGDVIKYRLHKEILRDLSEPAEAALLEKVMSSPHYRLLKSYQKANGYIGIGMHSWDKFKQTPLQDGEAAARLISYYSIPRDTPLVVRFADALRNDDVLAEEFSYFNPENERFRNRLIGTESGTSLKLLIDTCLALMGFGDDGYAKTTIQISYDAFIRLSGVSSIEAITQYTPNAKRKYNYRYIEAGEYYPCLYHLQLLSHTYSWRTEQRKANFAHALNHINEIFHEETYIHVRHSSKYYVPQWARILIIPSAASPFSNR